MPQQSIEFTRKTAFVIVMVLAANSWAGDTSHERHPVTGTETWKWRGQGINMQLTQILPDQLRGFYQARGFDVASAEIIAGACVFQTVLRNESAGSAIELNLADWRILLPPGERPLKLKQDWKELWRSRGVSDSAQLAFQWALVPTTQTLQVGDWIMGMTLYGLPPASRFDLRFVWKSGTTIKEGMLYNIRCANGKNTP